MANQVTCTHCGKSIFVGDERYASIRGKVVKCRSCDRVFTVGGVAATTEIAIRESEMLFGAPAPISYQPVAAPAPAPPLPTWQPQPQFPVAPPAPKYQCQSCQGWFETQQVYAVGAGYICRRCHGQQQVVQPQPIGFAPHQPVVIQNVINNNSNVGYVRRQSARWNPAVAALLSLLFPGLGQFYKGEIGAGIGWMFAVVAGYLFFVFPGLFLHICCVAAAAMGDPYR